MDDRPLLPRSGSLAGDPRAVLRRLAGSLLDAHASAGELDGAACGLHELLSRLAGLEEEGEWARESALPSGRALSPLDAAHCTRDAARTAAFLRGGDAALDLLRARAPDRAVEVLYAGSGPLAPLVLPHLARREAGSARVTLLDVHPAAAAAVTRLVEALGLAGFVRDVVVADATSWAPPKGARFDLLVVEAMERSLAREAQAALCRNLVPHLAPEGFLLPERVAVDLVLSDPGVETAAGASPEARAAARVPVGRLLELTRASGAEPSGAFPPVTVVLPAATGPRTQATLLTSVSVFGGHAVAEGASGLTTPEVLWGFPPLAAGTRVSFRYREGRAPGLTWSVPAGGASQPAAGR